MFRALKYPTDLTFAQYRASTGHSNDDAIRTAVERFGLNKFEIPIPKFLDLLIEQLLAPFFCFQVFCVALWAMDEFWYYSLMTLFMLVTFESTVVHQRLRNLAQVRALQQPKQALKVYRRGKWVELSGDDLVPGDVVSLARSAQANEQDVVVQADLLLLAGSCIVDEAVLTGESTPQWKNPIGEATGDEVDASELAPSAMLDIKRDRLHVVFGGTKLLQTTGDPEAHIKAPDNGCLAVVLRTGFGTAQGSLMRTILYSTERVTANNLETFGFILFLLVWAVAAAHYVLQKGLEDPDRDRFKLFLNCVMILTSVVPPELPMELTIAVNASLVALAKKRIFCTEPFRIPMAGKVTTCCFDKTGTLTSDHMVLEGVAGISGDKDLATLIEVAKDSSTTSSSNLPAPAIRVLVGCQSLVHVDGGLVGDPVEKAAVDALHGWKVTKNDKAIGPVPGGRDSVTILHRFHFSSALKRMSTIVAIDNSVEGSSLWVLMKGAPEVVANHLARDGQPIPSSHYQRIYRHFSAEGARVLALAYKRLPTDLTPSGVRHISRDEAEADLVFAGFAIFRSPLKPDSEPSLRMLRASQHQLVMITGDAALTACHAAAQVHIVTRQPLILSPSLSSWSSPDETVEEPFVPTARAAQDLAQAYDLCITGDALDRLLNRTTDGGVSAAYVCRTSVFARVTPEQKELVVKIMRAAGMTVLMCGDGTNDVGALKGAHVGVALLPPPEKVRPAATGEQAAKPTPLGPGGKMLADMRRKGVAITPFYERMAKAMDDMASGEANGDAPLVKPGDASMASPFTAKDPSVAPCLDILRQGRCTLVTTVQMFKILGLLSLSSAYSLSVLYLDGIKLGDFQATLAGMLTAGMFFFISNAQPLENLSRQRPHPNIFCRYLFTSLLGQFAVHMAFLMHVQQVAHDAMDPADRQLPDADFKPNLINTVCFLANFAIQTMTFAVNYVGEPFATPLNKNVLFSRSVRLSAGIYCVLVLDAVVGLNDWFSLVVLPTSLKVQMLTYAGGAFLACTLIERGARLAFPAKLPPEKGPFRSV